MFFSLSSLVFLAVLISLIVLIVKSNKNHKALLIITTVVGLPIVWVVGKILILLLTLAPLHDDPLWRTDWVYADSENQFAYFEVGTLDFITEGWYGDQEQGFQDRTKQKEDFISLIFGAEYKNSFDTICWETDEHTSNIQFQLGCRYVDDPVDVVWHYELKNGNSTLILSKNDVTVELKKIEPVSWTS